MKDWEKATRIIQNGGLAIIPTDTVFGLVCSLSSLPAIKRLYAIKQRTGPTLILVKDLESAKSFGNFDKKALVIAKKFWPGPLTLVVEATDRVPSEIQNDGTVGIRVPNFPPLNQLLEALKDPILAPSANFKGKPASNSFDGIDKRLVELVDYVVDQPGGGSLPSTIVKLTAKESQILREGAVNSKQVEEVLKGENKV